jgi:ornithine cyclodeaminase
VVEFEPQARIEGEIQQLDPSVRVTELADVLCQIKPGRIDAREISIFDSVGFALNDFSSLRYLHGLNREFGGVDVIDLIPALGDPKDLFGGLVHRESGATHAAPSTERARAGGRQVNRRRTGQPRHSQPLANQETLA